MEVRQKSLQVWECRIRQQFVGFYVGATAGKAKALALSDYTATDIDYADIRAKLYRCHHADEILAHHTA